MRRRTRHCLTLVMPLVLAACENYDIKVNEKLVYTPPGLFSDFDVTDPALRKCLQQAIADNLVGAANDLKTLNCSHAGIDSLAGLGTFTGISQLKLSSNAILNLMELSHMTALTVLRLDNNKVVDPVPLYGLTRLQELDLSANPALQCPEPRALTHVEQLTLPKHCPAPATRQSGSPVTTPPGR
jgi:hypothetical protein